MDPEPLKVDFPDLRPTPEQRLLEDETNQQAEAIAVELLDKMREVVRHKPRRYSRLARVAWHCYFDLSSPSQTTIARRIGISNSLVTHYRQLFDDVIRDVELGAGQYIPFLHAFSTTLEKSIGETAGSRDNIRRDPETTAGPRYRQARAAVASQIT